ncbi:MAG: hypothetical protein FJ096_19470, partial [Deltaproteobacteria bacterium]|nr:hypothetical protein [Deltaproteobacteria bacterium]
MMTTSSEFERLPGWLRAIAENGVLLGDDEREKLLKRTANLSLVLPIVTVHLAYLAVGLAFDVPRFPPFAIAASALNLCALAVFRSFPARFGLMSRLCLWTMLVVYTVVTPIWLGGVYGSGLLPVWGLFMLPFAFVFFPAREGWASLSAFVVLLVLAFATERSGEVTAHVPPGWRAFLACDNLVCIGTMSAVVMHLARRERERFLDQLEAERGRAVTMLLEIRTAREDAERAAAEIELQRREVERAKEIAEQATRTKSDFLANMSHE